MTAKQKEYRKFLKSEFWVELSGRVKRRVGKCQRCGSKRKLHAHHVIYRSSWYETVELVMLWRKLDSGRKLRVRDWEFLRKAVRLYPPTEGDGCIAYHAVRVAKRARFEYEHLQQLDSVV